jgi:hypothetical protein
MVSIMGASCLSDVKIAAVARSVRQRTDKRFAIVLIRAVARIEPDQVAVRRLWHSA